MLLPVPPFLTLLALLHSTTATHHPNPTYLFTNPPTPHNYHIPTLHDSAILARRIYHLSTIATFSTVFPSHSSSSENDHPPHPPYQSQNQKQSPLTHPHPGPSTDLSGAPIGLMDYYAACPPHPSHPTLLAINLATTVRNSLAGSKISMHLRWHAPSPSSSSPSSSSNDDGDPYAYLPANLPRFSLHGSLHPLPQDSLNATQWQELEECFFAAHPEARMWAPGKGVHESWWAVMVPSGGAYWVGGFGDRAFIGWIGEEEWDGVGEKEWRGGRLVGEEG